MYTVSCPHLNPLVSRKSLNNTKAPSSNTNSIHTKHFDAIMAKLSPEIGRKPKVIDDPIFYSPSLITPERIPTPITLNPAFNFTSSDSNCKSTKKGKDELNWTDNVLATHRNNDNSTKKKKKKRQPTESLSHRPSSVSVNAGRATRIKSMLLQSSSFRTRTFTFPSPTQLSEVEIRKMSGSNEESKSSSSSPCSPQRLKLRSKSCESQSRMPQRKHHPSKLSNVKEYRVLEVFQI
eukprot:TRINITY_DN215064_c0_g1_i1.p1 TRINITY_DN215064_c0_g1~~TRINITY_DN215064_c0_g1_i1.p1  ORF type:complete len:235 (+),score=46.70 TRINITY_DN215064_c0_g1_i1:37-741(+)